MSSNQRSAASVLGRPLCRRYTLGLFDAVALRVRDAQGVRERRLHWAFGWLADEECELLGAWLDAPLGLAQMLADLKRRGVLRIRTVVAAAVHRQGQDGAYAVLSDTAAYPFVDEVLVRADAPFAPPVPPSAALVAERLRAGLARAARRHGIFESDAAALDSMAAALQRAERRLDRERSIAQDRPRQEPGAPRVPAGI